MKYIFAYENGAKFWLAIVFYHHIYPPLSEVLEFEPGGSTQQLQQKAAI